MLKKILPVLLLAVLMLTLCACNKSDHEHTYTETIIAPTCQQVGFTQKLCTICGDEERTDYTPLTEHSGKEWQLTKEPTCQAVGTEKLMCQTCGVSIDTRSVAKLGHTGGEWKTVLSPTCTETGLKKQFCNVCSMELESQVLEKTKHTVGSWAVIKEATCKEAGTEMCYCRDCGAEIESRGTSVISTHDFSCYVTPPTEVELGYTTYVCGICGFKKTGNYVSMDGELDANGVYDLVYHAMVRVEAYNKKGERFSVGSGFFINDKGQIATNYHVVTGAYTLKVVSYSNKMVYVVSDILGYDKEQDVAIIQINKTGNAYLEFADEAPKTGDPVYTMGSPLGVDNVFSYGVVSNTSLIVSGKDCISFTAPISSGNSGGPLLNGKGQVLGINTMVATDGQNFNFAIKADKIKALDISSPTPIVDFYEATLQENAIRLLFSHFIINGTFHDYEDEYTIYSVSPESSGNVGLETYYTYHSEKNIVKFEVFVIQHQKRTYNIVLELSGVANKYKISVYDFALGQFTIEANATASHQANNYAQDYEGLFDITLFRYNDTDNPNAETMKQVFFILYQGLLQEINALLEASGTGLTMAHLNFKY